MHELIRYIDDTMQEYEDKVTGEKKHHTIRIKHIYCVINEGDGKGRKEVLDVE